MGQYIKDDDVKVRLLGKVRFTEDEADENKMHVKLLRRLIAEAEGEVELDLSPRYVAPFVTVDETDFSKLPGHTQNLIKTLCEHKAVMRVLETDFGRGTVADADKYQKKLEERYTNILKKLLAKREGDNKGWLYPPLPSLQLAFHNRAADDGYSGAILTTSQGDGGFPAKQINDPSENWWNGRLDPDDGGCL